MCVSVFVLKMSAFAAITELLEKHPELIPELFAKAEQAGKTGLREGKEIVLEASKKGDLGKVIEGVQAGANVISKVGEGLKGASTLTEKAKAIMKVLGVAGLASGAVGGGYGYLQSRFEDEIDDLKDASKDKLADVEKVASDKLNSVKEGFNKELQHFKERFGDVKSSLEAEVDTLEDQLRGMSNQKALTQERMTDMSREIERLGTALLVNAQNRNDGGSHGSSGDLLDKVLSTTTNLISQFASTKSSPATPAVASSPPIQITLNNIDNDEKVGGKRVRDDEDDDHDVTKKQKVDKTVEPHSVSVKHPVVDSRNSQQIEPSGDSEDSAKTSGDDSSWANFLKP